MIAVHALRRRRKTACRCTDSCAKPSGACSATLQKVSGIGAKIALAVLSGVSVDDFARLVQASDVTALTRIPGIGKKTAERMVVELRDRVAGLRRRGVPVGGSGAPGRSAVARPSCALQQLGYKPAEVARMVREAAAARRRAPKTIIRKALKSALR